MVLVGREKCTRTQLTSWSTGTEEKLFLLQLVVSGSDTTKDGKGCGGLGLDVGDHLFDVSGQSACFFVRNS